jgi:hypothetical protein
VTTSRDNPEVNLGLDRVRQRGTVCMSYLCMDENGGVHGGGKLF